MGSYRDLEREEGPGALAPGPSSFLSAELIGTICDHDGKGCSVGTGPSAAEIAARIVATLLDLAEERAVMVDQLGGFVRQAVEELDPECLRDTDPTWWQDLPPWFRLDAFDRLRQAFDQIKVLEVQAGVVVHDLRGMLALRPVGSPERPIGYTPPRAHVE